LELGLQIFNTIHKLNILIRNFLLMVQFVSCISLEKQLNYVIYLQVTDLELIKQSPKN